MNTNEIVDILQGARRRNLLGKRATSEVSYIGVFPFDYFPNQRLQAPSNSFYFVFNTDSSSKPGTHWLACYYDLPSNTLEFFDSYAQTPNFYNLTLPKNLTQEINQTPLQSEFSTVCGQYCIYYLVSRLSGKSTSVSQFSKTLSRQYKSKNARDSFVSKRILLLSKLLHSQTIASNSKRNYSNSNASIPVNLSRKRQKGTGSSYPLISLVNSHSTTSSSFFLEESDSLDSDILPDDSCTGPLQCCRSLLILNSTHLGKCFTNVFPL